MKKNLKNFLLLFCINLIPNFNNLFSMAKSPTPARKEVWFFPEPLNKINISGKTGSCVETTKKEIEKAYNKLKKLSQNNAKLFIDLLNHTTCDTQLEPPEVKILCSFGFLDYNGKKIPLISVVSTLMVKLEKGQAQIRSLEEIKELLQKII